MLAVGMTTCSEMQVTATTPNVRMPRRTGIAATRAIARYGIASFFGLKAGKLSVRVRRVHHAVQPYQRQKGITTKIKRDHSANDRACRRQAAGCKIDLDEK
jgi:hypothetical protein